MRLKSLRIRHYKSLDNVQLDNLSGITVLVGNNAAGKSNVIDALKFLRDLVSDGLDHAVSNRGGITLVRQYSKSRPFQISISIEIEQHFESFSPELASYEIHIKSLQEGNYRIEKESATWHEESDFFIENEDGENEPATELSTLSFSRDVHGKLKTKGMDEPPFVTPPLLPDQAAIGSRFYYSILGLPLARFLRQCQFSAIYPNTLKAPSRPDTDKSLKETGENWASILKSLRRSASGRKTIERIKEMMQTIIPTLEDVTVRSVGGYLVPQFKVKDFESSPSHYFDPIQLSDGTLRVFGILLALYQLPAPELIVIEEPEQTVNPGVLSMLVEAFREVSANTQIIITSHSPHLVDHFKTEEVKVVCIRRGSTSVTSIRKSQVSAIKKHLLSIEELMLSEGLQPETE